MHQSLRSKLLLFFILITFIPMTLIATIGYYAQKIELTKNVENSLAMYSSNISLEIKDLLSERLNDTKYLARNPVIMNPNSSEKEIVQQFREFLDSHNTYLGMVFVNEQGTVTSDVDFRVTGSDFSDREWFNKSVQGEVYMSDLYISSVLEIPMLVLSSPVYNSEGEFIGVVSPSFNIEELSDVITGYTNDKENDNSTLYSFLVTSDGEIIAHTNHDMILQDNYFEQYFSGNDNPNDLSQLQSIVEVGDGNEVHSLSKIKNMPGFESEWYVGVAANKKELYAPLSSLLQQYLIVFGIAFLIMSFAVVKLADYLGRPIQQLVDTTKSFAYGNKPKLKYVKAYKEINYLYQTFENMMNKLEEREKTHKKSTLVLQSTNNGVLAVDKINKKVTLFNPQCEKLFRVTKEEIEEKTIDAIMEMSPCFQSFIESLKQSILFKVEQVQTSCEIECPCHGELRTFYVSVSTLPSLEKGNSHEEVLIVFHDLTETKRMEKVLIHSEKMKMVGEMAAGLAHEIRNPLTTVRGLIQLIHQNTEKNERHYNLVLSEIDRVNTIITDLLNIAKPQQSVEIKETNINDVVKDTTALYETELGKQGIELTVDCLDEVPAIVIDKNKLNQVVINLLKNALEATDSGGAITVKTDYHPKKKELSILISDTGYGMDSETIKKLGTPFFTMKNSGTGLGLTMSYSIIEEMGGSIRVRSEIGKGTTFTICLPVKP